MTGRSRTGKLGEEVASDLARRAADGRDFPSGSELNARRQKRLLDRGGDLELPLELRLARALVEKHARLERSRSLVEKPPRETELLAFERHLSFFAREQHEAEAPTGGGQRTRNLETFPFEPGEQRLYGGIGQTFRGEFLEPHERRLLTKGTTPTRRDRCRGRWR